MVTGHSEREKREMSNETKAKGPSHVALGARKGNDGKDYYNRVGAAFAHKDGDGYNVELDSFPVDGRIILRKPKDRAQAMRDGDGGGRHRNDRDYER